MCQDRFDDFGEHDAPISRVLDLFSVAGPDLERALQFCRRFRLDDGFCRFLTCIMLFLVLFYVCPLKFLFNLSITGLLFGAGPPVSINGSQLSMLLMIFTALDSPRSYSPP